MHHKSGRSESTDGIFWISYADLTTSLMMCFLLAFLASLASETESREKSQPIEIKAKAQKYMFTYRSIGTALNQTERKLTHTVVPTDCQDIQSVQVDKSSLTLSLQFRQNETGWFQKGSDQPLPAATRCLTKLVPIWLGDLYSIEGADAIIEQLVIEGHTDSSWGNKNGDAFIGNLKLSQERAHSIASFILDQEKLGPSMFSQYNEVQSHWPEFQNNWLRKKLTATGRSFASPKLDPRTGSESAELSRRVEFKVVLRDQSELVRNLTEALSPDKLLSQ